MTKVHSSNDTKAKARMGRAIAIVRVSCARTEIQESRIRIKSLTQFGCFLFGTEYAERGNPTEASALSVASSRILSTFIEITTGVPYQLQSYFMMAHVMKLSSLTDELITVLTGFSVEVRICSTILAKYFNRSH